MRGKYVVGSIRTEIRRITLGRPLINTRVQFEEVRQLSDSFLRVTVRGEGLAAYDDLRPADAFKLLLPPQGDRDFADAQLGEDGLLYGLEGRRPVLRAFTVRGFDAGALRLTFDVLIHPGHTLSWLRDAMAGDPVGVAGMRVDFVQGEDIDQHVLIGDASALPAIATILDSLAPGTPATIALAVDHPSDRHLIRERRGAHISWVDGGSPAGQDSPLFEAVRGLARPEGRLQAWVCAETAVTRQVRAHLLDSWRIPRSDLHAAAYWRAGVDATSHDAETLLGYRELVAAGCDPAHPDTREEVELGKLVTPV